MNAKKRTYKTIFAIRVMMALKDDGVKPLFETDNRDMPGFKCWVYEITPEFNASMEKIMGGK
jgi:hypothetical protein